MAKKDLKARDEDEDDRDDEDDDPDAGVPLPAKGPAVVAAKRAAAKKRAPAASADHAGRDSAKSASHGGHGHDHDHDDATEDEAQDPGWWIPYAVLGGLVLVGVLGFFGAFTSTLKPMFSPVPARSAEPLPVAAPPTPATPPAPPAAPVEAETFGAKHLLVMHKESRRAPPEIKRSKEEALARAKEALTKAKAPGAKFESIVEEFSDEPGAGKRGGNLGNFRKGAMVKEFQEGLEKTKVGELSDVVETPFGYHVILRTK